MAKQHYSPDHKCEVLFKSVTCLELMLIKPLGSRYKDDSDTSVEEGEKPKVQYGVEFTFDADARVAITLYCQAFEEFSNGMAV